VSEKTPSGRLPRQSATFSNQSAAVLKQMILEGQLQVGQRINEVETAAALGISRAPLREAIQALVNEGLLVSIPGRGAFVRTFSRDELEDLYELRIALEVHALSLASVRASRQQVEELDTFLDETGNRMGAADERHYPGELDFHLRVLELSQSRELLACAGSVNQRISLARSRSGHEPERAQHAYEQHRTIVAHLRKKELSDASEILQLHLRESLANALMIFTQ
jgi:DNA-binding GntR family transcriptional regulator